MPTPGYLTLTDPEYLGLTDPEYLALPDAGVADPVSVYVDSLWAVPAVPDMLDGVPGENGLSAYSG